MPSGRNSTQLAASPSGSVKLQQKKSGSGAGNVAAGLSFGALVGPAAA